MRIKIGAREIGDGCPPFIIAEIGSNWRTLEDCLYSIGQAKLAGADAAKFQLYDHRALYGSGDGFKSAATPIQGALSIAWLPKLKAECDRVGIEFMCSAFSPEFYDAVNPYVNVHKVASAECTHKRILERLRDIGKPVFLSTGAHGLEDVRLSINTLSYDNNHNRSLVNAVPMYCVASYPATFLDLRQICTLKNSFMCLAGYSDHSTDVCTIPKEAVDMGACVIEKHVTFIEAETPDSPHSLSGAAFKRMVDVVHGAPALPFGPVPEENPMILKYNRRLIATTDIKPGDILKEGSNFGIYRSLKEESHAFSPWMIDEVGGRFAKQAIKAGDGIGPGDV